MKKTILSRLSLFLTGGSLLMGLTVLLAFPQTYAVESGTGSILTGNENVNAPEGEANGNLNAEESSIRLPPSRCVYVTTILSSKNPSYAYQSVTFTYFHTSYRIIDIDPKRTLDVPLPDPLHDEPCPELDIALTGYIWDFGDGSAPVFSRTNPVQYTYDQPGTYMVNVQAHHSASLKQVVLAGGGGGSLPGDLGSYSEELTDQAPTIVKVMNENPLELTYDVTHELGVDSDSISLMLQDKTLAPNIVPIENGYRVTYLVGSLNTFTQEYISITLFARSKGTTAIRIGASITTAFITSNVPPRYSTKNPSCRSLSFNQAHHDSLKAPCGHCCSECFFFT